TGSAPTVVRLLYGPANGGTYEAAWAFSEDFGPASNPPPVSYIFTVTGLLAETDYFYRYSATNAFGAAWSPVHRFTVLGPPGVNLAGGASGILAGRAMLNGTLTSLSQGHVSVFWGHEDGGTNQAAWDHAVDLGFRDPGLFSTLATGLIFGLETHYRVYASNLVGEAWSAPSMPFKTPIPESSLLPGLTVRQFDSEFGPDEVQPIRVLQNKLEDGTEVQLNDLTYNGNFSLSFAHITADTSLALLWEGAFRPPTGAGIYTFGIEHDDRAILALDLDGDGDFDDGVNYDSGELIVDGGAMIGGCCGTQIGEVNLADREYRMAIGFEQGLGPGYIDARWGVGSLAFNQLAAINATSDAFFHGADPTPFIVITNRSPASITADTAELRAGFRGLGSAFEVFVYWGESDAVTNASLWDEAESLGWLTNVSSTTLTHLATGLSASSDHYFTFRITNCLADIWATYTTYFQTQ
ncbi:MAG: fibronectin type III domain-containing protein, partial [Verrucomicrobiota bacterium]